MMMRARLNIVVAFCLAGLPALALAAPGPSETDKKAESPAAKTRAALEKTFDVDITDVALPAAITKLRDETKINFVLDHNTLINFVGDPNGFVVSMKKNTKLKTGLRGMLSQHHLSYAIVGH